MISGRQLKNVVVTVTILTAAVAAALLMGYDVGRWIRGALGYVAWSLLPYALLLGIHLATCAKRLPAFSARETAWSLVGMAVAGPLLYADIRFLHPDAQGAIAMLMVPILQCLGIFVISAISLFWHYLQKKKAALASNNAGSAFNNPIISLLNKFALVAFAIYLLISALQYSDAKTIDTAKVIDFFINQYCETHGVLPTSEQLRVRFPDLNRDNGWFFYAYTDNPNWLKMQYPVKWSNSRALGKPQTSEFTATTYSYTIEYRCGGSR